ncbi:universal stress protein [Streptomyces sp. NPDC001761]
MVVGVDGSRSSYEALRWAVRYAGRVGGAVEAVAVWNRRRQSVDEDETRQELTEARRGSRRLGAAQVVHGDAADVLLRAAEGAEVLVVGSRGRGGFARALLGSVSRHVSQHASCPVVIVRPPEQ